MNKKTLLLDEPASNLDPEHQLKALEHAKMHAQQGTAVFIIVHDHNLAAAYADQIVFLHEGKFKALGSPQEVLTQKNIAEVLNIHVDIRQEENQLLVYNPRVKA